MKYNNLIKLLTFANLLLSSGWGLVAPVFAIYVTGQIEGADIALVGLATASNMVVKSILQVPFGRMIDGKKGEIDDFFVLFIGSLILSLTPLSYLWVRTPLFLILSQMLMGLGGAMLTPGWLAIFTRHIDKHSEAEEWGFTNATIGIGIALTAALGGFLAEKFGFAVLFVTVSVVSLLGNLFLFYVYQDLKRGMKG